MAELTLIPLTFEDVAIYFSEQEWQYLQTWQKKLYKHVMRTNYETLVSLDGDLSKPELILWIEHGREPFGSWEESQKLENLNDSSAEAHFGPVTEQQLLGDPLQGLGFSGPLLGGREDVFIRPEQGLSLVTPQRPDTLAPGSAAHGSSMSVAEGGISSDRALGLLSWQGLPRPHPACGESFSKENHLGTHPEGHSKAPASWAGRTPASQTDLAGAPLRGEPRNVSFSMCTTYLGHARQQPKDPLPFHCSKCEAPFSLRIQLHIHQQKHKDPRLFPCSECSLAFPHQCHLQEHQHLNSREKPFQCPQCPKSFRLKDSMRRHQLTHSAQKPFQCPQCPKSFHRKSSLREHELTHSTEKPFPCGQCGKSFIKRATLTEHLRLHSGEKPFQCPQCPKSFRLKGTLRVHKLTHSTQKPFQCPQCPKSFCQKGVLREHQHTHSAQKPFQCPKCPKSFCRKGVLREHQHTHSMQKPFQCPRCPKSFCRKELLQNHQHTHGAQKPYPCSQCGKSFIRQAHLTRHLGLHSGKRHVQCSLCGKSFRARADMKTYQLLHGGEMPFSCKCGKGFAKQFQLVEHIRTHIIEKPFQCHKCKKLFQCLKCNKAFRLKTQLRSHQGVHTGESPKSKLTVHVRVHTKRCPAPWVPKPDPEFKKG
ncbi:zinc finger protein 786-like [Perognathus longimembris pacificus]|uniref:zinc finger protein 786-like n=1 Tax=Perognathus longimembris pacificus TaxID=214514 RepID=UPI002019427E|nr:zinc finger protein 786-like [Perognathus longimembris pacificus]